MTAPESGYSVPRHVPVDLPLVVRPNRRNAALLSFWPVPVGVALVLLTVPEVRNEPVLLLIFLGCMVPVLLLASVWRYFLFTAGGPRFAAGPAGMWVRARGLPVQTRWFPWAAIERVYLRRALWQTAICIDTRDPRATFTTLAWNADRPVPEIMATLTTLAAGRAVIGGR